MDDLTPPVLRRRNAATPEDLEIIKELGRTIKRERIIEMVKRRGGTIERYEIYDSWEDEVTKLVSGIKGYVESDLLKCGLEKDVIERVKSNRL